MSDALLGQARAKRSSQAVAEQIAELEAQNTKGLQARWLTAFGRPHPKRASRDLLLRMLAYHVQEKAEGGLSKAALKRLADIASNMGKKSEVPTLPPVRLRPGTRLVREWQGEMHQVAVLEKGFEYRGAFYTSLSLIARTITGTRWSGPAFFGLRKRGDKLKEIPDDK